MLKSKREIVFLGDFNIDMLYNNSKPGLHKKMNPFAELCDQLCLTNTTEDPTRVTNTSKSLIYVILVNRPER